MLACPMLASNATTVALYLAGVAIARRPTVFFEICRDTTIDLLQSEVNSRRFPKGTVRQYWSPAHASTELSTAHMCSLLIRSTTDFPAHFAPWARETQAHIIRENLDYLNRLLC